MQNLHYKEFKCQDYFSDKTFSISQKRTVFKFRTHNEIFKDNFKSTYTDLNCSLCNQHYDSQAESFTCEKIFDQDQKSRDKHIHEYKQLFQDIIPKSTVDLITRIKNRREALA